MTYESEMADNYRSRARQLRALADIDREAKTAALLRSVAESYDIMAASLDAIDRENHKIRNVSRLIQVGSSSKPPG
jgi:hypothetical protein